MPSVCCNLYLYILLLGNPAQLHPHLQQHDIVEYCNAHGIHLQAYCPLMRGPQSNQSLGDGADWAGKPGKGWDAPALRDLSKKVRRPSRPTNTKITRVPTYNLRRFSITNQSHRSCFVGLSGKGTFTARSYLIPQRHAHGTYPATTGTPHSRKLALSRDSGKISISLISPSRRRKFRG